MGIVIGASVTLFRCFCNNSPIQKGAYDRRLAPIPVIRFGHKTQTSPCPIYRGLRGKPRRPRLIFYMFSHNGIRLRPEASELAPGGIKAHDRVILSLTSHPVS